MDKREAVKIEEKLEESRVLENQAEFIGQQISELKSFRESLSALKKNSDSEVLASLGRGVFLRTDVRDKDLFVDVGGGIVVKKSPDETLKILEEQLDKLSEVNFQISNRLEGINFEMGELIKKLELEESSGKTI